MHLDSFLRSLSPLLGVAALFSPLDLSAQSGSDEDFVPDLMEEGADFARWYVSPGLGWAIFEGDEPMEGGIYLTIRLGYDIDEWWSVEGSLLLAPKLDENFGGSTSLVDGRPVKSQVSRSKGDTNFGDTYMFQTYVDFLFHFTRWEKLDPYLTFGAGLTFYGKDVTGDDFSPTVRAGCGLMYHFNEEWALRADVRALNLNLYNTEFNATLDIGLVWTWGARKIRAE